MKVLISLCRSGVVLGTALLIAGQVLATDLSNLPQPLRTETIPDKPDGAHWAWITDINNTQYAPARLFDMDTKKLLGHVELGFEGNSVTLPSSGKHIYMAGYYYSRGYHGERADVVEIIDKNTLQIQEEIKVAPKLIRGWPSMTITMLTDDDRFMLVQFFTPASSIGIIDLEGKKYVGEFETAGCWNSLAAGPRQAAAICGDGSVLAIDFDDNGNEVKRQKHLGFFDPDADPIFEAGYRTGNDWLFASHRGMLHAFTSTDGEVTFKEPWRIGADIDGETWVPGPIIQPITVHHARNELYALMHVMDDTVKGGGTDFHRKRGTHIWVFDLNERRKVREFELKVPATSIDVSQDDAPLLYVLSPFHLDVDVYQAASGEYVHSFEAGVMPGLVIPVN